MTAAQDAGATAMVAGHVERGAKRVVIEPLGIEYTGSSLELRA